jgi:hypothetical protein
MVRAAEDRFRVSDLLQAAEVHDGDPVRDVTHDAEVVGDEDVADALLRLQLDEQVEDRGLHRDVERRGRLVAEDDARVAGEGARDRDALLQATGQLSRLRAHERLVEAHGFRELDGALVPVPASQAEKLLQRTADDTAHGVAAVERSVRVLEDDLERAHLLGAPLLDLAREPVAVHLENRAFVGSGKAEKDAREGRLAASRLADEPEHLARADDERDVHESLHVLAFLLEGLGAVGDLEEGLPVRGLHRREPRGRDARELVSPVVEVTAACAAVAERIEVGLLLTADLFGETATRLEDAAGQVGAEAGEEPGNRVQRRLVLAHAAARDAAEEADGVRVPRVAEDLLCDALLDEAAGVEDAYALAHLRDDGEVVTDEKHARAELLAQSRDEVEHLRLHRRVEAGRGLVEDEKRRVLRERHRDHHPLLHPAGQLVRIPAHDSLWVGDLHLVQHRLALVQRLLLGDTHELEHLGELRPDADGRVQSRRGVLVHHRKRRRMQPAHLPAAHAEHVLAVQADRAAEDLRVAREVAHDRERRRRLPAPGLPDEPVRLALADREGDTAEHAPIDPADAVGDLEILELDGGFGHRSKTCEMASAIRLMPMIRVAMASEGKSTAHQTPPLMNW